MALIEGSHSTRNPGLRWCLGALGRYIVSDDFGTVVTFLPHADEPRDEFANNTNERR